MKHLNRSVEITKNDIKVIHSVSKENEQVFDLRNSSPESVDNYFSNEGYNLTRKLANDAKLFGNAGSFNRQYSDLTLVLEQVASQLVYADDIRNFINLDVRNTADKSILVRTENINNSSLESYLLSGDEGNLFQSNISFGQITMPCTYWGVDCQVNFFQQTSASQVGFDYLGAKTKAVAKTWAGHLLKAYMTGLNNTNGLLNLPSPVSVTNTTLVTKSLSSMTDAEFNTFLAGLIAQYANNIAFATAPDTFVIPSDDYFGLVGTQIGTGANSNNGVFTRLERIKQALVQASGNLNAQVLPSPYAMKANNASNINKNVYALYRKDLLAGLLPMDLKAVAPIDMDGYITKISYVGNLSGVYSTVSSGSVITYFVY